MYNKDDVLKKLRSDPLYRSALKMVKTDEERRRIIATAEGFLTNFVDVLTPIAAQAASDPDALDSLRKAMGVNSPVVRESDGRPVASGSKG